MIHIARVVPKIQKSYLNYAMACVAKLKGVQFYQFTPEDINYENRTIEGTCHDGDKWTIKVFPYPNYIYDRMLTRGRKHKKFYDEFKDIPFSNEKFPSGSFSKSKMYQVIEKGGEYTDYLIPYHEIYSPKELLNLLNKYDSIICKPDVRNEGINIFFVEFKENQFYVNIDKNIKVFNSDEFEVFLTSNVFVNNKMYILQPFITSKTKFGNPFDIRVNLMKNERGKWSIPKIYARIGPSEGVVSNILAGGTMSNLQVFATKHLILEDYETFRKNLRRLSLAFANHLEKQFDFHFCEMGLDFAIDENGKLWIFEVNMNHISLDFFTFEAAAEAISYGKHVALKYTPSQVL